jgi:GAF domain-containing protein
MTDNTQSNFDGSFQPESNSKTPGDLNPIFIIESILNLRGKCHSSAEFTEQFLQYLVQLPDIILSALYQIDHKTNEISLSAIHSNSIKLEMTSNLKISPRSSESLARVSLNAQPVIFTDLETEHAEYQNGILDPKAQSLFIYPILKSGQVIGILDIQSSRSNGIKRDDLTGLSIASQLFGIFLVDFDLDDKSGLRHDDLVNFSSSAKEIILSDPDLPRYQSLLKSFQGTDLVAFIFSNQSGNLILLDLYDAKGTGFDSSLKGLQVDPGNLLDQFSGKNPLYFSDLSEKMEYGDLFSFFIRRECSSISVLPILVNENIDEIVVIGSRDLKPISTTEILPFAESITIYEKRKEFDNRIEKTTFLERELTFISSIADLGLTTLDRYSILQLLTDVIRTSFNNDIHVSFLEIDQSSKQVINKTFFADQEIPVTIENNLPDIDLSALISQNEPFQLSTAELSFEGLSIGLDQSKPTTAIPVISNDAVLRFIILQIDSNSEILQQINPVTYSIIGKLVSSSFIQSRLITSLTDLDKTMTRTVSRQQALNQVTFQSSEGRSFLEVLSGIPSKLVEFGICQQAGVFIPTPENKYEMRISAGFSEELKNKVIMPGSTLAGNVADSKEPLLFSNSGEVTNLKLINPNNLSGLAVPISFGDELFAILEIEHSDRDHYAYDDLELLNIFAQSIGSRLANLKLVDQVRSQVLRQERLYDVTNKLRRTLDMESILKISAAEISKIVHASKTSIQIKVEEEPILEIDDELSGGDA